MITTSDCETIHSFNKEPKLIPRTEQEAKIYKYTNQASKKRKEVLDALPENFLDGAVYERFRNCGQRTVYCRNCGEMSHRYMVTQFCKYYKFCAVCMRQYAREKSLIVSKALSDAIADYRDKGVSTLPCMVSLSLHRSPEYDLSSLIKLIKEAFSILQHGGTKAEVLKAKRRGSYDSWWQDAIIGSIFSIETPFNEIVVGENAGKFAFGVHLHALVLRHADRKVSLGVDEKTGKPVGSGLRSDWTEALRKVWGKHMSDFPFPHEEIAAQADIRVAYRKIKKANRTIKIPLTSFFEGTPDNETIQENIASCVVECCKYIVKPGDLTNLINEGRIEEFILKTSNIQLRGVGGIFRTGGYMKLAKKEIKKLNKEREEMKIEVFGGLSWERLCPMCLSPDLSFGEVSLSDVAISEHRLFQKIGVEP